MGKGAPTLPEIADFLEAAERAGPREHAIACLLALHGLDLAGICGARIRDLGHQGDVRTLAVSLTRGGRRVAMPLAPRTAAALDVYVDDREDGFLLLGHDGGPLGLDEAAGIVRRIVRAAGLGHRLTGD